MRKYLFLDGFFQAGRSFFGAISAVFLLSKGVPLSELATLKIIQSLVALLFEIPTGLLADLLGRKISLLFSLMLGATSFLVFSSSSGFWDFAVAESLLALCLSFWSGAYDAFAIESLKIAESASDLNQFYHGRNSIGAALTIFSGFAGGVLALKGLYVPYLASFVTFILIAAWLFFAFPTDVSTRSGHREIHSSFDGIVRASIQACLAPAALPLFLGFALMEIILQPLIYYWQPWFEALSSSHAALNLGSIYVVFQLAIIGSGLVFAWLSGKKGAKNHAIWITTWLGFSVCMLLAGSIRSLPAAVFVFTLSEVFFTFGESTMKAVFNQRVSPACRASCLSVVGFGVRCGSLVSLFAIRTCLRDTTQSIDVLKLLFTVSGCAGVGFCFLLSVLVIATRFSLSKNKDIKGFMS